MFSFVCTKISENKYLYKKLIKYQEVKKFNLLAQMSLYCNDALESSQTWNLQLSPTQEVVAMGNQWYTFQPLPLTSNHRGQDTPNIL